MVDYSGIKTWIFDLDETLYPVGNGFLQDVFERFPHHIVQHYNLTLEEVRGKLSAYAQLVHDPAAALKKELKFDQNKWDEDCLENNLYHLLQYCEKTDTLLAKLSGRKVIFTNGSERQSFKSLDCLQLRHHFDYICSNDKRGMRPKPMPEVYAELVATLGVDPKECVMVEDGAKNLEPAHVLGMKTVLVNRPENPNVDYVHHHYKTLLDFLEDATK